MDNNIWNDLWICSIIAEADGFKLDLCSPDELGRQVAVLMRFFDWQDIDLFFNCPNLRSDIIFKAYECMNNFTCGKKLTMTVDCDGKSDWEFENE